MVKNLLWAEKYRPRNLDKYIGKQEFKDKIKGLIMEPISMPHFLFTSRSPGTGKTSLAYVIKNEIGCANSDVLVLNSSDDRKIETIRSRVKSFATTMRSNKNVPRLVIMDEFDGMLSVSQDALRFIMEKYSSNCKFILTANNETKIIQPIKSRCVHMQLKEIDKEEIYQRLSGIVTSELGKFPDEQGTDKALRKIIEMYYPDIRKMINNVQEISPNITLDKIKTKTEQEQELFSFLINSKPRDARKYFIQNGLDPKETLKYIMEQVLTIEQHIKITPDNGPSTRAEAMSLEDEFQLKKNQTVYEIMETDRWISVGADPDIQIYGFILKFIDIWR